VLDDIARHIAGALPREAVGLLWEAPAQPAGWVPLRNTSFEPESSYAVNVGELMDEFQLATGRDIISSMNDEGFMLTLWHSHPSGQVGPSRGDLREKHDGLTYMVIAVDEDGGLRATLF
jgi:proteasome lid subunit RPN8/RPN11